MQAIVTKYLPATNYRGSRVKAQCERGSITISYSHEARNSEHAHSMAADALVRKFIAEDVKRGIPAEKNNWAGEYISAGVNKCYVFIKLIYGGYGNDKFTMGK